MKMDGRACSLKIREELKKEIVKLPQSLILGILLCNPNDATKMYVKQKKNFGEFIGAKVFVEEVPQNWSTRDFVLLIRWVGRCESVDGMIVQLPLPAHFDVDEILDEIPYEKDVDTMSSARLGKILKGKSSILPPIVAGVKRLFEEYRVSLDGKEIVLVGTGDTVGRPFEVWLLDLWLRAQAVPRRICILNDKSGSVSRDTVDADIIFSGTGIPGIIKHIKKGAVVVDCGSFKKDGIYQGDVAPIVYKKAGFYTPVPGGVGPMTVAYLFWNLARLKKEKFDRNI